MAGVNLPVRAHADRPWRIHELTADFRVVDVWALPTPGSRDEFPALVDLVTGFDPASSSSRATRGLFALRDLMGRVLRLDDESAGLGSRVASLRERMPADLREAHPSPTVPGMPFEPLFQLDDEWAAEIANRTVHGVIHLGWVPGDDGAYRGQLTVLVRLNGLLGGAYLTAITPFRHHVVYPALMRDLERGWRDR